ncbi:MAG: hypothetical protein IT307_14700 [Chloroflexi bacterium]|nr:hypothetical protein [Chloroflexota bacterium]
MRALFGGALLVAAVAGVGLSLTPAHPLADVTHYKYWARLVTTEGIQAAYSGEYPRTYSIYPPVTLYGLRAVGGLYEITVDPTFDLDRALASQALTTGIRLMAVAVHLTLAATLYLLSRRLAGERAAALSAGLFAVSPGALWDQAVWGQPDSWHSLSVLLGLWWLGGLQAARGWGMLALAALTKPQAWVVLPLAGLFTLRRIPSRGMVAAAAAGLLVAAVVLAPFALTGRLATVAGLPSHISRVMPVVTANAHNVWWIVTRASPEFALDSDVFRAGLTFRQVSAVLLVGGYLFVLGVAWSRASDRWGLLGLAAFNAHAWFCLTVGAHENHPFLVLPLLALVAWRSRFLAVVYVALTVLLTLNVLLHDPGIRERLVTILDPTPLELAASWANLGIAVGWAVWLLAWRPSRVPGD